mgnify:FL=1
MSSFPVTGSRLDELIAGYYADIDLGVYESLIVQLEAAREELDYRADLCDNRNFDPDIGPDEALKFVSPERLEEVISEFGDKVMAVSDQNQHHFNALIFKDLTRTMARTVNEFVQPTSRVQLMQSGRHWYPSGGYMGWHTNSNVRGFRLYCSHAKVGDASFFRYRDPLSGEIVTSWDRDGWNFRLFRTDCAPLWHCVYSATDRISLGYTIRFLGDEVS